MKKIPYRTTTFKHKHSGLNELAKSYFDGSLPRELFLVRPRQFNLKLRD